LGTRIWAFAHVMSGAVVGDNCNIGDHAFIETGACVGNNVTVKNHVCIWEGVTVEDDVFLGPHVVFTNDLYPRSPRMNDATARYEKRENWLEKTVVEQGCSIGANSTILPGLTLGAFSMIAAGSTVTRNVKPHALMMGSPARPVGVVCRCGLKIEYLTETTCRECRTLATDSVA
jgi:UDP-2-acetamido-3-amino-2,3-dideoxy-glucuronate N-acetyltransferase